MEEMSIIILTIVGIWLFIRLSSGSRNDEDVPSQSAEPETSMVSSAEPEIAETCSVAPEISKENSAEPGIAETSSVAPEHSEENSVEPEVAETSSVAPKYSEEKSAEPEIAETSSVAPKLSEENSVEPGIAEMSSVASEHSEENSVELEVAETSSVAPNLSEENSAEPGIAETSSLASEHSEGNSVELEVAETSSVTPEPSEENSAEPGIEEKVSSELKITETDSIEPELSDENSVAPDIEEKISIEPEIVETSSAEPELSEDFPAESENVESNFVKVQLAEPEVAELNILESQPAVLGLSKSKITKQEASEPNPGFTIEVRYGRYYDNEDYIPDEKITTKNCWVPAGASKSLCGINLTNGNIYVGRGLAAGNGFSVEPALVDPSLKVDWHNADTQGIELSYWPYYHMIGARARAGYLQYLASNRDDPQYPIGFVFLYFYGLERRLIVDAESPGIPDVELNSLILEVERLLRIYGHNHSFRGYATRLLDFIRTRHNSLDLPTKAPKKLENCREIPLSLQVELGIFSVKQSPIPAEWAYAWIMQNPQFQFKKRKVAERCAKELWELFKVLYRQRYGEGIVVKANKTRINADYYPASPGIRHISKPLYLPKITILKGPNKKLAALIDMCFDQLDTYSRFIGRHPERKESVEALALLPADLITLRKSVDVENLGSALKQQLNDHDYCRVPFSDLSLGEVLSNTKPSVKSMSGLAGILECYGIGIEPDARYTGSVPDSEGDCIIFSVERVSGFPLSVNFKHAAVVIRFAGFVLYGQAETLGARHRTIIDEFLGGFETLTPLEIQHLKAFFFWRVGKESTLAGMRKQVEGMPHEDITELEHVLVRLACADGVVDSYELKKLKSIASLLRRDPETLYTKIHSVLAEPTLVRSVSGVSKGFRIPAPTAELGAAPMGRVPLDAKIISHKRQETKHISNVLNEIFGEQASSGEDVRVPPTSLKGTRAVKAEALYEEGDKISSSTLGGLDASHRSLLEAIALHADGLSREEAETKAAKLKLLLSGALDLINEIAFEMTDCPVIEELDGILMVDFDILKEMQE